MYDRRPRRTFPSVSGRMAGITLDRLDRRSKHLLFRARRIASRAYRHDRLAVSMASTPLHEARDRRSTVRTASHAGRGAALTLHGRSRRRTAPSLPSTPTAGFRRPMDVAPAFPRGFARDAHSNACMRIRARHELCFPFPDGGARTPTNRTTICSLHAAMIPSRDLAARFEAYADWRRRLSAGISSLHEWL